MKWKRWSKDAQQKIVDFQKRVAEWELRDEQAEEWLAQYKKDLASLKEERNLVANEVAKGTREQNVQYCSKGSDGDEANILWSKGIKKPIKLIEEKDMYKWQTDILELLETEPDDRSIHWYVGPGGCGKTCFCKYLCSKMGILALEIGDSGTPHVQGYIEFTNKLRPFSLKLSPRVRWEVAKGTREQNVQYCSKGSDGDEANILWSKGIKKPIKLIEEKDMYKWQTDILELLETEPDDRSIHWYVGPGGCGKTCFCKYLCSKMGAIMLSGKGADVRNGVVEYVKMNGYTPEIVLVNIPRSMNSDYLSYEGIENIKDMCFYSGKYEGGMVLGNCPHLLIFANELPDMDKCSKDRWKITILDSDEIEIDEYKIWKAEQGVDVRNGVVE